MNKIKYLFGNWKMNNNLNDAIMFVEYFNRINISNLTYGVAMNNLFLSDAIKSNRSNLQLMAQDVSVFDQGSYTGQTSAKMLSSLNIKYAIVGHSETRRYLNVNTHDVKLKVQQCLNHNIIPIICIGEDLATYNKQRTIEYLINELSIILEGVDLTKIIIAYEPLWAIGTGKIPSNTEISNVINALRNNFSPSLEILYGGSVDENNISELSQINHLAGFLVGTASIFRNSFIGMINKLTQ